MHNSSNLPVALLTGAARRIGAMTAETLHAAEYNVVITYRTSADAANALVERLNAKRPNSAYAIQNDILDTASYPALIEAVVNQFGQLDVLINNASTFYPTPPGSMTEAHWDDLIGTNLKAPIFLSQAAIPYLQKSANGNIINIVDIHADRPIKEHTIYCAAKAGLAMVTKSLARELAPSIRVNGIAPGAILWPEDMDESVKAELCEAIPMKRPGDAHQIADTAKFLITGTNYINGQIIAVDGGRTTR